MAGWEDVRRLALALPETTERGSGDDQPQWRVRDKLFVWDRPLRRTDLEALGDAAPDGPIVAARIADEGVKDEGVIVEAWLLRAPKRVAAAYLAARH